MPVGSTRYDKSRTVQNEMKRIVHNDFFFTIFFIHAMNFTGIKSTSLIADEIFLILFFFFFFFHLIPFSMEKESIIRIHLLFYNIVFSSFTFAVVLVVVVVGFISFLKRILVWLIIASFGFGHIIHVSILFINIFFISNVSNDVTWPEQSLCICVRNFKT